MSQYTIRYQGKVIVGAFAIVDLQHAQQIKAAIDSPVTDIEVTIVEELTPPKPRELPKVGYWMSFRDDKDGLFLQTSESPYGGWSFEDEGYDRACRVFPRKDGNPPNVLVYAKSSDEAIEMAHELRNLYAKQHPQGD